MNMQLSDCARILGAEWFGEDVVFNAVSTDTRSLQPGALFVALVGNLHNGHDHVLAAFQAKAAAAIVSEDINISDLPYIKVADTGRALQAIAQYQRQQMQAAVVAITGSCGKTTCRALVASILQQHGHPFLASRKSFNNAIGVPLTLCKLDVQHEFAVLELGANHAGEIAALSYLTQPQVAVLLNAAPVHLEGFGDLQGVACAKAEIFQGLAADGFAVLNADDPFYKFWSRQVGSRKIISFAREQSADVFATEVHLDQQLYVHFNLHAMSQVAEIRLQFLGEHNVYNALAATAAALALGIPFADIVAGLQQATPEVRRLRSHQLASGVTVIDDTYNANPQAMAAAIDLIAQSPRRVLLVVGDMAELGSHAAKYHRQVGEQARAHGVRRLYAVGEHAHEVLEGFGEGARHFKNKAALIAALQAEVQPDDVILVKGSRAAHLETVVDALLGG